MLYLRLNLYLLASFLHVQSTCLFAFVILIYVGISMYARMLYTFMHMGVCVCIGRICICTFVDECVSTRKHYACMYILLYFHKPYTRIHLHTYIHMRMHVCVCIHVEYAYANMEKAYYSTASQSHIHYLYITFVNANTCMYTCACTNAHTTHTHPPYYFTLILIHIIYTYIRCIYRARI